MVVGDRLWCRSSNRPDPFSETPHSESSGNRGRFRAVTGWVRWGVMLVRAAVPVLWGCLPPGPCARVKPLVRVMAISKGPEYAPEYAWEYAWEYAPVRGLRLCSLARSALVCHGAGTTSGGVLRRQPGKWPDVEKGRSDDAARAAAGLIR